MPKIIVSLRAVLFIKARCFEYWKSWIRKDILLKLALLIDYKSKEYRNFSHFSHFVILDIYSIRSIFK